MIKPHSYLAVLLFVVTAFLLCMVPIKAKSALGVPDFINASVLGKVDYKPLTLLEKSLSYRLAVLGNSNVPEDNLNNQNRFDDTALEGQQRQQELLDSNEGFNISGAKDEVKYPNGTLGNPNPADGPDGGFTFLTDKKAFENVLGDLPTNGGKIKVSKDQLDQLEDNLGLTPGTLDSGSVLRRFENFENLPPSSPLDGNQFFRGPGKHLPDGSPEIVVNPAQVRTNNPNIGQDWIIEVVE